VRLVAFEEEGPQRRIFATPVPSWPERDQLVNPAGFAITYIIFLKRYENVQQKHED
jgi:hypothetical protein